MYVDQPALIRFVPVKLKLLKNPLKLKDKCNNENDILEFYLSCLVTFLLVQKNNPRVPLRSSGSATKKDPDKRLHPFCRKVS
jgi:hypothetical protein